VRPDGDPDTYLETDGLATSSSNGRHDAVNSSDFVLLLLFQSVSQLLDCPFIYFLKEDCPFKRASLCSQASAAYTERLDDEEVLCGAKEEEWARVQEPAKTRAGRATPGIGFEFCHWFCFQISMVYCFYLLKKCMLACCSTECQNHLCRQEAALLFGRKESKQQSASLYFGSPGFNGASFSPNFVFGGVGLMNKGSTSSHIRSDVFHSPLTPSYLRHRSSVLGYQKGWSSERVPLPSKGNRRYPGSSMAFPYNNGRALPSKWEDAERWIFSPKSSDTLGRTSATHVRRPKSKSGPLGPPGRFGGQYSSASSSVSLFDNERVGQFTANSPFVAGVLMLEHVCGGKSTNGSYPSSGGRFYPANGGSQAIQLTRVHRRLDIATESSASLPSTQESIHGIYYVTTVSFHRVHIHYPFLSHFSLLLLSKYIVCKF
jgi:hypothetical protein